MGFDPQIVEIALTLRIYPFRRFRVRGLDHPGAAFLSQVDRLDLLLVTVLIRQIGRDCSLIAGYDLAVDLDLSRYLPGERFKIDGKVFKFRVGQSLDSGAQ